MSNNDCRKLWLRLPVPEAHLRKKNILRWELLQRRCLQGSKHDVQLWCAILGPSIQYWDWSYHPVYHWYEPYCISVEERGLLYHIERPDVVQDGILHPLSWFQTLQAGNWCLEAPEDHQTACKTWSLLKDASCKPDFRVNLVNKFWQQVHYEYFRVATYQHYESGILIHHEGQLHSTNAHVQWRLYWSWHYGEDTTVSYPARQVQCWLLNSFQPSIKCEYTAKCTQTRTHTPPSLLDRAIFRLVA